MKTSRPLLQMLLFGDEEDQDDMRSKNIRQTGSFDIRAIWYCMIAPAFVGCERQSVMEVLKTLFAFYRDIG